MTDDEVRVADEPADPARDVRVEWDDPARGLARVVGPHGAMPVLVEGSGTDWHVTVRGRRIPVTVRTRRERLLAAAEREAHAHAGPVVVKASLPGLIVAIAVDVGDEVLEGEPLLTIEAMKMQNEVRAPRTGTVIEVSVASGVAVSAGTPLVRLE
jgi:biotin carboxyl carrier protein